MNQELLPCPFCGGQNFARGHRTMTDRSHEPVVLCLDCDCRGPLAAWNSRSPPPVAVGVEEIARIIDPQAWKLFDEEGRPRPKNPEVLYWKEYYRLGLRRSLETATAILAVLNPPTSEKPKP